MPESPNIESWRRWPGSPCMDQTTGGASFHNVAVRWIRQRTASYRSWAGTNSSRTPHAYAYPGWSCEEIRCVALDNGNRCHRRHGCRYFITWQRPSEHQRNSGWCPTIHRTRRVQPRRHAQSQRSGYIMWYGGWQSEQTAASGQGDSIYQRTAPAINGPWSSPIRSEERRVREECSTRG